MDIVFRRPCCCVSRTYVTIILTLFIDWLINPTVPYQFTNLLNTKTVGSCIKTSHSNDRVSKQIKIEFKWYTQQVTYCDLVRVDLHVAGISSEQITSSSSSSSSLSLSSVSLPPMLSAPPSSSDDDVNSTDSNSSSSSTVYGCQPTSEH